MFIVASVDKENVTDSLFFAKADKFLTLQYYKILSNESTKAVMFVNLTY